MEAGIPKLDFRRSRFQFLEWLNGSGLRQNSQSADTVATHSDLNQVIVINWAILMWWPHTASGQRIKALRRRPHSWFFSRSSRKLEETTPRYGYVLGATQQEMLRWLYTSMSTWINSLTIWKYFLVWGLYKKNFLEPCRFSLAHYLCVSIHNVYIRVCTSCWTYVRVQVTLHTWTL